MMINSIEVDPFEKGKAYIAGTLYKKGDYEPYLYKTDDYGKSWEKITEGIPNEYFTRVLRADPKRKGLLYAGTEKGMFISFDYGESWDSFQLNLPIVPITDLAWKEDNLIAATQGRSFWLIDDLTPLHQIEENSIDRELALYDIKSAYRMSGSSRAPSRTKGQNYSGGVGVNYYLKNMNNTDTISLKFSDSKGESIQVFSNFPNQKLDEKSFSPKRGSNRFTWDMMYAGAERFEGMILWWASLDGPMAIPGKYKATLAINGREETKDFEILIDPRSESSLEGMQEQFDFIIEIRDELTRVHKSIKEIRAIRKQITGLNSKLQSDEKYAEEADLAASIIASLTEIEETLYQTKSRSGQDPLNYPIRLNNKLAHLNALTGMGDFPPTDQAIALKNELVDLIEAQLSEFEALKAGDITKLNNAIKQSDINFISVD
jgi:hypothetical protein